MTWTRHDHEAETNYCLEWEALRDSRSDFSETSSVQSDPVIALTASFNSSTTTGADDNEILGSRFEKTRSGYYARLDACTPEGHTAATERQLKRADTNSEDAAVKKSITLDTLPREGSLVGITICVLRDDADACTDSQVEMCIQKCSSSDDSTKRRRQSTRAHRHESSQLQYRPTEATKVHMPCVSDDGTTRTNSFDLARCNRNYKTNTFFGEAQAVAGMEMAKTSSISPSTVWLMTLSCLVSFEVTVLLKYVL